MDEPTKADAVALMQAKGPDEITDEELRVVLRVLDRAYFWGEDENPHFPVEEVRRRSAIVDGLAYALDVAQRAETAAAPFDPMATTEPVWSSGTTALGAQYEAALQSWIDGPQLAGVDDYDYPVDFTAREVDWAGAGLRTARKRLASATETAAIVTRHALAAKQASEESLATAFRVGRNTVRTWAGK